MSCFLFWVQLGSPYGAGGKEAEGLSEGSEDHLPKKKKRERERRIIALSKFCRGVKHSQLKVIAAGREEILP